MNFYEFILIFYEYSNHFYIFMNISILRKYLYEFVLMYNPYVAMFKH